MVIGAEVGTGVLRNGMDSDLSAAHRASGDAGIVFNAVLGTGMGVSTVLGTGGDFGTFLNADLGTGVGFSTALGAGIGMDLGTGGDVGSGLIADLRASVGPSTALGTAVGISTVLLLRLHGGFLHSRGAGDLSSPDLEIVTGCTCNRLLQVQLVQKGELT